MSRRFRRSVAAALCLAVAAASMMGTVASAEEIAAPELENPLKAYDKNSYSLTLYQKMVSFFPTEKEEEEPQTPQEETPGMSDPGMMAPGVEEPSDAGAAEESPSGEAAEENEEDAVEQVVYPDEYAGAYIDDNDNLHIKLVGKKNAERYEALTNNDESVIIEEAATPLSKLHEIQDALDEVMVEFEISETRLQEDTNTVDVYVTSEEQSIIFKYLNSKILNFSQKSVKFVDQGSKNSGDFHFTADDSASNVLAGSELKQGFLGLSLASAGFNAYDKRQQRYGIVTAAHYAEPGNQIKNAKGTLIGSPTSRQLGDKLDAAFIPFENEATLQPTAKIKMHTDSSLDDNVTGYLNNDQLPVGLNTVKIGRTTGYTSGKILTNNQSFTLKGHKFNDQILASNLQKDGDSGGPIFHTVIGPVGSGEIRPMELIGIATVAYRNQAIASKAQTILDSFNLRLYRYK